ncbi:D-aminoacyl-tRNA deacylase [Spectribacter hydrogenoxidans]|uniref:D-aminoacyl-tRNA deacylase n=1 Tax=Spectribacter hydrogenoxidans TaxID=3075608 RepID=A0ABU3BZP3_9GAMM|nr:D-aminoacyl-tRNA deacylase [Salinisphaera sp. W335]MDT0634763.1 D-aminoacyl-tRNA deacylase [Salinisphaera sp. W335]
MIGLLQRVTRAGVDIEGETVARIETGLLVLVAVNPEDTPAAAQRLAERLLTYRVFPDPNGRMNLALADTGGGLLLVPQFTLAARTDKGTRASFTSAAPPDQARALFETLVTAARGRHADVQAGRFGADMAVSLTNDGPVTFWLET